MKLLLIGPQGCGKGTIGRLLSEKMGIPLLSVGDLFRSLPKDSPYYQIIHEQMERGVLVDNRLAGTLLKQETENTKYSRGYIFDGWGRQMSDLDVFDPGFDFVIIFDLSRETSVRRISGRRLCESDGKTYNIYTLPQEELAKCPGTLIQREDDTEEAVNRRLDTYYTTTMEVVKYFDRQGKAIHVNAEPLPEVIFNELMTRLG